MQTRCSDVWRGPTSSGDGPVPPTLVCGFLACDARPFNPLLVTLPPVIKSGDARAGSANMATVAAEIGYGFEAAFSRAFKKLVGVPPSTWGHRLGRDGRRLR